MALGKVRRARREGRRETLGEPRTVPSTVRGRDPFLLIQRDRFQRLVGSGSYQYKRLRRAVMVLTAVAPKLVGLCPQIDEKERHPSVW